MSTENPTPSAPEAATEAAAVAATTPVDLAYPAESRVGAAGGVEAVSLVGNQNRDPVRASARVLNPVGFREAMCALYAVVASDLRYVPKDRTAWLAFKQARQRATAGAGWEARREYFSWLWRNDPLTFLMLDPIVSVFPDELSFEVFSRDESSYARLAVSLDGRALAPEGERVCGTTNIDFSEALYAGLQHLRSYRETRLSIGPGETAAPASDVGLETSGAGAVLEKKVQVPDTWLRGFLQVQSAATLGMTRFQIAPIDLYNVLRHLRMHADQKRKGRGLRVELIPGERPRLILEPWEEVFPTHGEVYQGRSAQVIRVWGRRRLMLLRRFLPMVQTVDVYLLGSGLPSFWVLSAGPFSLTLGMSGFTDANWAQAVSFDLLLPRRKASSPDALKVIAALERRRKASVAELVEETALKTADVVEALQRGCQQGLVMFDMAAQVYRYRPVLGVSLDTERFEYRNKAEKQAYDLLAVPDAVRLDSENRIPGAGLELVGRVTVAADRREYRPQVLFDDEEGRVKKAECTCAFFRKHALKEGPCAHLVALTALHAQEEAKRRAGRSTEGRRGIQIETRAYVKRSDKGEELLQVSLNRKRLHLSWGPRGAKPRSQTLFFDTPDQAREAYFAKVDALVARGYLDTTAG